MSAVGHRWYGVHFSLKVAVAQAPLTSTSAAAAAAWTNINLSLSVTLAVQLKSTLHDVAFIVCVSGLNEMELGGLPSTVMPTPDVTLTFYLLTRKHNQYVSWTWSIGTHMT